MTPNIRWRRGLVLAITWIGLMLWLACGGGGSNDNSSGGGSTIAVAPGFTPDPQTRTGQLHGALEASNRSPECRGYIGAVADYTLQATQPFTFLRVAVTSPTDTTLVIQMGDGTYRCNDDTDGTNPVVQGPFPAGIHRIFVGSYHQNETGSYTLTITGNNPGGVPIPAPGVIAPPPMPVAPPVVPSAPPGSGSNYGSVSLAPGFMPDPQTSHGQAGGPVSASTLNAQCRGYVTATPDHLLQVNSAFGNLRILVSSQQDTTLIVQGPDGSYRCDDDTDTFNPVVEGAFAPGTYRIWVGSYSQSNTGAPYTIGFSELPSVRAADLR